MALIHIDRPKILTERATVPNSLLSKCEILYAKKESGIYEFAGLYDSDIPDKDYPDGMAAFSFRSVYVGTETLQQGTHVWNVNNSSDDTWTRDEKKQLNPNWLSVWNTTTNNNISSDSGTCYVRGSVKTNGQSNCSGDTLGGHIAISQQTVNPEPNDYIYIIPICRSHNHYRNVAQMTLCQAVEAVKMNRFME